MIQLPVRPRIKVPPRPVLNLRPKGARMTLVVGLKCAKSIILGAEQEEQTGIAAKRHIPKLKRYEGEDWALGFSGAGDGAIIDTAERRLAEWLDPQITFSATHLAKALEDILADVYSRFIDPDSRSEGISLVIGVSCKDGLSLIQTHKRAVQFQDWFACSGYGSDVALYLLDRLYEQEDKWVDALRIAGFAICEAKSSSQYCGGESDFLVLQQPPHPRWRQFGAEFSIECDNAAQNLVAELIRPKLIERSWRPELTDGYIDEHNSTPYTDDLDINDEERMKEHINRVKLLESQDE